MGNTGGQTHRDPSYTWSDLIAVQYFPRLGATCVFIFTGHVTRGHAASAGFALFLTCSLMVRQFGDIWQALGWIGLYGGFLLAPRKQYGWPFKLGLILLGFHLLAIPGNLLWGGRNWESTTAVVLWMAPSILLLIGATRETFAWMIPAWLIHAGLMIYQGVTNWFWAGEVLVRGVGPTGLSHNPNLAAGFLSLGIVYLMTTRYRWLVLILLPALSFTGSRWGIAVTGSVLLIMIATRVVPFRPIGATLLLSIAVITGATLFSPLGYRVATIDGFAAVVHKVNGDVKKRLGVPHIPSPLPHGVAAHPGLHNVPLRIAYENGILAALIWLGVTGWALWPLRRQQLGGKQEGSRGNHQSGRERFTPIWWLLLALALLSMLDYYTWMGHLGGFWWLLVGLRLRRSKEEKTATAIELAIESARFAEFDDVPHFLERVRGSARP